MKEEHIPLFGLESQEPIKNLDFIGLTLNYEMCYTNVLQILDLGQIPLLAKDRTEDDPLVIGSEKVNPMQTNKRNKTRRISTS